MKRLLLGLAAAATAVCAAPEPAYRELPPEPPPAAARPGTGTPSPDDLAARQAVQGLTAFCQSLTAEQHAAAVEWSNENRGRENNERLGELTWKIGQAGTSGTPVIQARLPLADKWERYWLLVAVAKIADLKLPPLGDYDWGSGVENRNEGYKASFERRREDVMKRAAFVRQWWNEKGKGLYDRQEADQPRGAGTPAPAAPAVPVAPVAPADPPVRRRLVDAVNMSYRLHAWTKGLRE
jgi:hypothetical protein